MSQNQGKTSNQSDSAPDLAPDPAVDPAVDPTAPLVEGRDYTNENGLFVLTADYLLRRGYCCNSGCRNCPYGKAPR